MMEDMVLEGSGFFDLLILGFHIFILIFEGGKGGYGNICYFNINLLFRISLYLLLVAPPFFISEKEGK
jgi:hypothetical protein